EPGAAPAQRAGGPALEPDLAQPAGHLGVAAPPANPLLPERRDRLRLLGPDDGVGLEYGPLAGELALEGGDRVLGQRAGVDLAPDRLQARALDQLRAAGQAGLGAEQVLGPSGAGLGGDVLEGDEPVQVVLGPAALADVAAHGADVVARQVPG